MDELIAFWTARLDEAEAVAREAADGDSGEWFVGDRWNVYRAEDTAPHDEDHQGDEHQLVAYGNVKPQSDHIAANDPASVLADIAADRAVLNLCARVIEDDEGHVRYSDGWAGLQVAERVARLRAARFASHPQWQARWTT